MGNALTGQKIKYSYGSLITVINGIFYDGLGNEVGFPYMGGVTSIGISVPSWLTASGPITSAGIIDISVTDGQISNKFLASPDGITGSINLRSITQNDIPNLNWSKIVLTPTSLSGYGIIDGVNIDRNLTINGITQNLSNDRSWTIPTTTNLSVLTDVNINSIINNQLLKYDSSSNKWINFSSAGITKTDDTNITLTLGGNYNTALLQPISLTIGWNGTLADNRISSASIWNAKQNQLSGTGFIKISGTTISYDNNSYYLSSNPNNYINLTNLGVSSPLSYNNITGIFSIFQSNTSTNGYLSSSDWNTFNNKQNSLSGTGFVKISGTTISYDNNSYYLTSNPNNYINLTNLSAGTGISYNNLTGVITNSSPDQTIILNSGTGIGITGTYPNFTITNTVLDIIYTSSNGINLSSNNFTLDYTYAGTFTNAIWHGSSISDSYISSASIWNNKQNALNGIGLIKSSSGVISYINDSSSKFVKADGSLDSNIYLTSAVVSVNGTTNRIISSSGNNPNIDISSNYIGQSSITTLGTITSGIWHGSSISDTYISSASTWNNKQNQLSGTGFIKISGTTISYDNSSYYLASNPNGYIILSSLSTSSPLSYNNLTGVFSISLANTSTNGYLNSTDWNTFNNKQNQLSGTGFIKISGTTISYDNNSYYLTSNPNGYTSNLGTVTSVIAGNGLSGGTITNSGVISVNTSQNVSILSNLTSNGFIKTSGNNGTLIIDTNTYLTSNQSIVLSGEATGTGSTFISVTLNNNSVVNKTLTGYSSAPGTISAADTIVGAISKLNGNLNSLTGFVIYKGLWNANTNTPTLTSGIGTQGWYYKVSVAGTTNIDGISQWNINDSIIFDGTTWDKIFGGSNEVVSVNGLVGAVPLTGTINEINISSGNIFSISSTYIGQSSITTLGTITSGIWNGSSISDSYISSASTWNAKQNALSGTGFIKISGTTISYDNSSYYLSSNPNNYISLTNLSAGTGISYNNLTGVITNSSPDQVVSLTAGSGINITGTYPNFTIINTGGSGGGSGTVTSVNISSSDITIGSSPITTSGTITLTLPNINLNVGTYNNLTVNAKGQVTSASNIGYLTTAILSLNTLTGTSQTFGNDTNITIVSAGTTHTLTWSGTLADNRITSSSNWNSAYTNRITSLTTTGSSGNATLISNVLNIPTYTLSGLGGISLNSLSNTSPITYNSSTGAIGITQSNTSTNGYLSSTDWNTFNNKQPSGAYLTSNQSITLSGEASGTGSTSISVTLSNSSVIGKLITGFISGSGTLLATDSILQAIQKLDGNIGTKQSTITTGTTSQYFRGDLSLAIFPTIPTVTPSALTKTDDTNITLTLGGTPSTSLLQSVSLTLGWTGTLADNRITSSSTWNNKQNALSGTGFVKISGTTISYDNNSYYLSSNPNNYISLTNLSANSPLSYNNTTGVFSLTTGYVIPTTTEETNWNTAYTNRITSLTTTGSSGSASLISNTLNIPTYTLSGLGGFANPLTNAGDIMYGGVSGLPTRLGIGTANQVLHGGSSSPSYSAIIETDISLSNNTTNDVSSARHGFMSKLPGGSLLFYREDGTWVTPSGTANSYLEQSFTSQTSITVTHNFGAHPIVQIIDGSGYVLAPLTIQNSSLNVVVVTFSSAKTGKIICSVGSPQPAGYIIRSTSYNILSTDMNIEFTATATATLPDTAANAYREYWIVSPLSGGTVTVNTTSSQLINGSLTQLISNGAAIKVISNGTSWHIK